MTFLPLPPAAPASSRPSPLRGPARASVPGGPRSGGNKKWLYAFTMFTLPRSGYIFSEVVFSGHFPKRVVDFNYFWSDFDNFRPNFDHSWFNFDCFQFNFDCFWFDFNRFWIIFQFWPFWDQNLPPRQPIEKWLYAFTAFTLPRSGYIFAEVVFFGHFPKRVVDFDPF